MIALKPQFQSFTLSRELEKYPCVGGNISQQNGIEVPSYARNDDDPSSATFLGRSLNALLKLTDPKATIYSQHLMGWYNADGEQLCGIKFFSLLRKSIGVQGMLGLETLLVHAISNEMQRFLKFYRDMMKNYGLVLEQIRDNLCPEWKTPDNDNIYTRAQRKVSKLMVPFMTFFSRIGQMQLSRKQLKNELQLGSRVEATKFSNLLSTRNKLFLKELVDSGGVVPEEKHMAFQEISDLLTSTGAAEPLHSIFFKNELLEGLPVLIILFIIKAASDLNYDSDFSALVGTREEDPFDGWTLVAGISTLLRQFHPSYAKITFALLGQFVTFSMRQFHQEQDWKKKHSRSQLPKEVKNTLIFMRQVTVMGSWNSSLLFQQIPSSLIELYELYDL